MHISMSIASCQHWQWCFLEHVWSPVLFQDALRTVNCDFFVFVSTTIISPRIPIAERKLGDPGKLPTVQKYAISFFLSKVEYERSRAWYHFYNGWFCLFAVFVGELLCGTAIGLPVFYVCSAWVGRFSLVVVFHNVPCAEKKNTSPVSAGSHMWIPWRFSSCAFINSPDFTSWSNAISSDTMKVKRYTSNSQLHEMFIYTKAWTLPRGWHIEPAKHKSLSQAQPQNQYTKWASCDSARRIDTSRDVPPYPLGPNACHGLHNMQRYFTRSEYVLTKEHRIVHIFLAAFEFSSIFTTLDTIKLENEIFGFQELPPHHMQYDCR